MELFNDDFLNVKLDRKADLIICDPPYGSTNCKWDKPLNLELMWDFINNNIKSSKIIILFCTTKFGIDLINSNRKNFKYDLVWEKNNSVGFLSCKKMPLRKHEMIYIFKSKGRGKLTYNPQMSEGKPYKAGKPGYISQIYRTQKNNHVDNHGTRYPISILKYNHDLQRYHPTQKPIDLLEYLIKTYSNEGDTVLDFCMGSGSAGLACKNTNRNFIGIEKDKEIFETAKKRLEEITQSP